MKSVIVLALLFCFATNTWTAPVKPIPVPMQRLNASMKSIVRIKSITELRQIKFRSQPVLVKSPDNDPGQKVMSVNVVPGADAAYKTGSGVILRPASLKDPVTGSIGNIYLLHLSSQLLTKLQNKEPDIEAVSILIDQAHSTYNNSLFSGIFHQIPQGSHTYVFTCRVFAGNDIPGRLWFYAGDQQIGPDKQTVNAATNEISIIFTYKPKDSFNNYLNVGAYLKPNETQSTYSRGIHFWYMQLVQIN